MACTPESLPVDVDGVGYRVTVTAPSLGRLLYSSELSAAAAWKRFTVDFGGDDPAGATVPLLFTVDFVGLSGEAAAPTAGALVTIDQLASGSWASLPVDVGGAKLGLALTGPVRPVDRQPLLPVAVTMSLTVAAMDEARDCFLEVSRASDRHLLFASDHRTVGGSDRRQDNDAVFDFGLNLTSLASLDELLFVDMYEYSPIGRHTWLSRCNKASFRRLLFNGGSYPLVRFFYYYFVFFFC